MTTDGVMAYRCAVEVGDPRPVRAALVDVAGRDRRLHLERSRALQAGRRLQATPSLGDGGVVPQVPVLFVEHDQVTGVIHPGGAAGIVEEHQRQQPERLGLVGHQGAQDTVEPYRLGGQATADQVRAGAGRVALVEEQVQHGEHGGRALHQLVGRRHHEGNPGVTDLALGPDQPLGHGRLGHEKGPGDLVRRHARQRAQGQCHLRLERQCGVAAREHQAQPVVGHLGLAVVGLHRQPVILTQCHDRDLPRLCRARPVAPETIEGAVTGHRRQPRAGAARDAVAGPALQRGRKGILRALLGQVPVAGHADQRRDDPSPFGLEGRRHGGLDVGGYISQIGLTSMPPFRAPGIFDATSIASSRSLQSTT